MSAGVVISKVILWGLGGVILVLCGTMSGFWPVILNYQLKTVSKKQNLLFYSNFIC